MADSPLAANPYSVLGVAAGATEAELRRAYRRRLRETHPDSGGTAERFHAVQHAWELVGTPEARAAFDRGAEGPAGPQTSWAPRAEPRRQDTRARARSTGHPGGWFRERYLEELREWVGRGAWIKDPYAPELLRSAPREVVRLLAAAVAEEETARELSTLGVGFTIWHDVRSTVGDSEGPTSYAPKIDHIVLGPTGLWALLSEDWGAGVQVRHKEVVGHGLRRGERPVNSLSLAARSFGRTARVRFSALVVVVPDGDAPEGVVPLGSVRGTPALLVERPRLADLLRHGLPEVGVGGTDIFELRSRVGSAVRFV